MSERTFVVSDAHYLSMLAECYLISPEGSDEATMLGDVLGRACARLNVNRGSLLRRIADIGTGSREPETGGGDGG